MTIADQIKSSLSPRGNFQAFLEQSRRKNAFNMAMFKISAGSIVDPPCSQEIGRSRNAQQIAEK